MSLFAVTARVAEGLDRARRAARLDAAVRAVSPQTLLYDETPGTYLFSAETTAQALVERLSVEAELRPGDVLVAINLSRKEHAHFGSAMPGRLQVLLEQR